MVEPRRALDPDDALRRRTVEAPGVVASAELPAPVRAPARHRSIVQESAEAFGSIVRVRAERRHERRGATRRLAHDVAGAAVERRRVRMLHVHAGIDRLRRRGGRCFFVPSVGLRRRFAAFVARATCDRAGRRAARAGDERDAREEPAHAGRHGVSVKESSCGAHIGHQLPRGFRLTCRGPCRAAG